MGISLPCCGIGWRRQDKPPLDAKITQHRIAALYDKIAPVYDLWGVLTESKARNRAIELADVENGQHILEVAVGTGSTFYEIVKRNPNGINEGVDISQGMLAKAKKRLSRLAGANYTLTAGTAFNLNVADDSVDLLVNHYMFDLIPFKDMDRIIFEYKRVLKKGGKLVLVNMTLGERFGSGLYDFLTTLSPTAMGGCRGVQMTEKLQLHGFTVEAREYHQQMLFPSEVILARK